MFRYSGGAVLGAIAVSSGDGSSDVSIYVLVFQDLGFIA